MEWGKSHYSRMKRLRWTGAGLLGIAIILGVYALFFGDVHEREPYISMAMVFMAMGLFTFLRRN